jgi:pantothenate kinase
MFRRGKSRRSLFTNMRALPGFPNVQFMTGRMEGAIKLILKNNLQRGLAYIIATGGGAHRFQERFKEALGITLVPRDELGTIVRYAF